MKRVMVFLVLSVFIITSCASFYTGGSINVANTRLDIPPRERPWTGPLSATDLAELAVENSLDLKAEKYSLEARVGAWRLGFRGFLPRFEASAGSDERLSFYSTDSFGKNLSVSMTQALWDGGRLVTARSLESAAIILARAELERRARDIGEESIAASRSVLSARARLEIKRSSRDSALLQRSILMAEIDLGLAMMADLLEVETSIAEMDLELAAAELELSSAQAELAEALCVSQLPELSERLVRHKPALHFDPNLIGAAAVDRSPELTLARYSLIKKRTEYKASRYSWLPTIGLKLSGIVSGSDYPLTRPTWSAGLTIDFSGSYLSSSGNIQFGGEPPATYTARTNNRLELFPDLAKALSSRQAKFALDLETEGYAIKLAQVERSALLALGGYENSVHRRDLVARKLELDESKLRLVELKVGLGQALRSDLVKTELERATSELELVDAVTALDAAERGLERLLNIPPGTLASFFTAREGGLQ